MTLAIPTHQLDLPCPHRWLLESSGYEVAGKCAYCGMAREFLGSWDEDRQQAKKYGRNYQTLRGAAKKSAERRHLDAR